MNHVASRKTVFYLRLVSWLACRVVSIYIWSWVFFFQIQFSRACWVLSSFWMNLSHHYHPSPWSHVLNSTSHLSCSFPFVLRQGIWVFPLRHFWRLSHCVNISQRWLIMPSRKRKRERAEWNKEGKRRWYRLDSWVSLTWLSCGTCSSLQ